MLMINNEEKIEKHLQSIANSLMFFVMINIIYIIVQAINGIVAIFKQFNF